MGHPADPAVFTEYARILVPTDTRETPKRIAPRSRLSRLTPPRFEHELDAPPEWEALDGKRACRIALYRDGAIEDPEEKLEEYRNWAVEQVLKLKRVFDPRLQARESGKAG